MKTCSHCGKANPDLMLHCIECQYLFNGSEEKEEGTIFVPGTVVHKRFKIIKYLASGGFANVYLAEDKDNGGKVVVVKACLATTDSLIPEDKDLINHFRCEAKLLKNIDSPYVVHYIADGFENRDIFVIVMEYAGETVHNVLLKSCDAKLPPLTESIALSIIAQCVLGLRDVYANGCQAHRNMDMKNIYISDSGVVKISDFSIAKIKSLPSSIIDDRIIGKFRYMAPECFNTPEKVDWLVDQYALGVNLVLLLTTGKYPFDDPGDSVQLALKIASAHPANSPLKLKPGCCSDTINNVTLRMLSKAKEDRFATPDDLFEALGGMGIVKRICSKCLELNVWVSTSCSNCKSSFELK